MIKKLKFKFILLSMISLFVLLALIVSGMNILNYRSVVWEADSVLNIISRNHGTFPEMQNGKADRLPPGMSPELSHESRYFSVILNNNGEVIRTEMSRIISVDDSTAAEFAHRVMKSAQDRGFTEHFRFVRYTEGDTVRITFLDCGRKLDSFYSFLYTSCLMAFAGFAAVFFVISFFAGRIIRPIAESYEKQKRFITDAGHEIKTPLTIINANVDVLEMDIGKNECLDDIAQQTKRLTALTNDLVYLARMEESENSLQMIDFPVSEAVAETANPFKTLAQAQEKEFNCSIQPMLSMKGDYKSIQQLVSLLMDNALKYSPKGSVIELDFSKHGHKLQLSVRNTSEAALDPGELHHVFDRFYRADPSRNSKTGGHGIGLSVAKAIVAAHNGRISASAPDKNTFLILVTLPI